MKYWLFLCAILLAGLRAPEILVYTIFLCSYTLFAIEHLRSQKFSPIIFILVPILIILTATISLPRGHHVPGLIQLGIMVMLLVATSYAIAGFRMAKASEQGKTHTQHTEM